MRVIVAAALLLASFAAHAQTTCGPASTVTPQPWNEVRLNWMAPTTLTNGQPIPSGTVLTYTVYRRSGTATTFTAICTTTASVTAIPNQPVGANTYTVTAKTATSAESGQAIPHANKTVTEPAPNPPTSLTIASTRIEPDSWTCRDGAGLILTRHERQDKAQESCTNFALANVGVPFEMRPSGYRIVAAAR
jgi:hypothetical protein